MVVTSGIGPGDATGEGGGSGMVMGRDAARRQRARQQARRAGARRREVWAEQDRRIRRHVEAILVALAEREDAVARAESEAGRALLAMTGEEGVVLRDAVEWCGGALGLREASRLRSLARASALEESTRPD